MPQLKRPLTFSTWVTAQKTPKSRSADEDAAREREREGERERDRSVLQIRAFWSSRGQKSRTIRVRYVIFSVSEVSFSFALVLS